jgi:hypothetical protein
MNRSYERVCHDPKASPMERENALLAEHCAALSENTRLRNWISNIGEQHDICTFDILDRVCSTCNCPRKDKLK